MSSDARSGGAGEHNGLTGATAAWDLIRQAGVSAKPMADAPDAWDAVLGRAGYVPARYTRSMVAYQAKYASARSDAHHDLSMVLYHHGQPAGVWPLAVVKLNDRWGCESVEREVYPPLFAAGLGERLTKALIRGCVDALEAICRATAQERWRGTLSVGPVGVDAWHRQVMTRGATASVTHELFCDLSLSLEAIHANLRKSYKALLTRGARLWQATLLDHVSHDVFTEYRALHARVAGRVTRPPATWDLQEEAINHGHAFLVVLRNTEGTMVGGGLFALSRSEGLYAVGAYDRALFGLPLGHIVQINAIQHMRSLGLQWYRLGDRPYAGDATPRTDKEIDIAHFKEGFATHMFVRLHTSCPVPPGP